MILVPEPTTTDAAQNISTAVLPVPARQRRIALIGYAPNVRLTPWADTTIEIWGLNDQPWTMPRVDVLFELHKPDVIKAEGHWDRLKELKIPVFMQEKYPEIPSSVEYPLAMVRERYTVAGCDHPYLTCSASLMMAVAIESLPTALTLDVYGVDMAQDTEFSHQRPSCEFWMGVAYGRGIKLSVQQSSDLLKTSFLYGYDEEKQTVVRAQQKERHAYLVGQMNAAAQKEQAAKDEKLQYIGAVADIEHVLKRWS